MKTNLLITSLSLIATSAYAQPSVPSVGVPPPTVRAEMPGQGVPSMPQPQMTPTIPNHGGRPPLPSEPLPQPMPQMNQRGPQPAVGATGGTGGNGGNGGLLVGNGGAGGAGATPKPSVAMYNGVGPLPANDAKGPTSVGASQSGAQARAETKSERQTKDETERMAAAIVASELVILYNTIPSVGVPPPTVRAEIPREAIPLPANDAKGSTSVGSTQSEAQAVAEARAEARAEAQAKGQDQGQAARAVVQTEVQSEVHTINQTK